MSRHLSVLIVVLLFSCITGKEFKQHIKPSIPWLFLLWVGLTLGFKPKIKASIVREKYEVSPSASGVYTTVRVCRRPGGWRRGVGTTRSGWAFNVCVCQLRKEDCSLLRRSPLYPSPPWLLNATKCLITATPEWTAALQLQFLPSEVAIWVATCTGCLLLAPSLPAAGCESVVWPWAVSCDSGHNL